MVHNEKEGSQSDVGFVGDIRVYDTDTICVLMHSYRRTDHSACVCVCVCVW